MGALDGRVAVITGAGRGLGREHALLFAAEGAKVVVNDLGGGPDGAGSDAGPAREVVDEIRAAGGEAIANADDVTSADGAQRTIQQAIDEFGALHVLVNNAGILRDRTIVNMTDGEWDDVIRVHLRGHFMPTRAAARYAIAPAARTRLTLATPGIPEDFLRPPAEGFDAMDPANVSPFVGYLATADCPIKGRVFYVAGGGIHLFQPFAIVDAVVKDGRWTIEELAQEAARLADVPLSVGRP
jgi:NAD(P)-dependent dehydrogenase (short-subunit alcohol dehydrogenase family)